MSDHLFSRSLVVKNRSRRLCLGSCDRENSGPGTLEGFGKCWENEQQKTGSWNIKGLGKSDCSFEFQRKYWIWIPAAPNFSLLTAGQRGIHVVSWICKRLSQRRRVQNLRTSGDALSWVPNSLIWKRSQACMGHEVKFTAFQQKLNVPLHKQKRRKKHTIWGSNTT